MKISIAFQQRVLQGLLVAGLFTWVHTTLGYVPNPPTVTITAHDQYASEIGPDPGTFRISRTGGDPGSQLVVFFETTTASTAESETDYQPLSPYALIPSYASYVDVPLTPKLDSNASEGTETVEVRLIQNPNYPNSYWVGSPNTAIVYITDASVVTITASDATAAEVGADTGTFTVTRTGGNQTVSIEVSFQTPGGTAENGVDYQMLPTSVTIEQNEDSADVTVTPVSDSESENSETVILTLAGNGNYAVGNPDSALVTIKEPPTITLTTGDNLSYLNGSAPKVIDGDAELTDLDSPTYSGGRLTVSFANASPKGQLFILNRGTASGEISIEEQSTAGNYNVKYSDGSTPIVIGTFTAPGPEQALVVDFNSSATREHVQVLMQHVTYHNFSTLPSQTQQLQFVVRDDQGLDSAPKVRNIDVTCPNSVEAVLIIDKSGSMTQTEDRLLVARKAATNFVRTLQYPADKVGVIAFCGSSERKVTEPNLTTDGDEAELAISTITQTCFNTLYDNPLADALADLNYTVPSAALRLIILLTDGEIYPNDPPNDTNEADALAWAATARNSEIRLVTIGLGSSIAVNPDAKAVLKKMASVPGDLYLAGMSAGDLDSVYAKIANSVCRSGGGTATPTASPVCTGSGTTITLTEHLGNITKWQYSSDDFNSDVHDITSTDNPLSTENLTETTYYRAVVQYGSSPVAYSSVATVTVSPLSQGGAAAPAASPVCTGSGTTITLTGHVGDITKWQYSSDNFSTDVHDIASTDNPLSTGNLTATTYFRAVVTSGACGSANSSVAAVMINDPPTLTTVAALTGAKEGKAFPISYEYLMAQSDAADPDGDVIVFRIKSVTGGTVKKAGQAVVTGDTGTLIGPGESLTWTPPSLTWTPPIDPNGQVAGAFTIRAWDGHQHSQWGDVPVTVAVRPPNSPPVVDAGPDLACAVGAEVVLAGLVADPVTDDGLLTASPAVRWTRINGPGVMELVSGQFTDEKPTVKFLTAGHYVLRLTADDGQYTASDEINVDVCGERSLPLDVIILQDLCTEGFWASPWNGDLQVVIDTLLPQMRITTGDDSDKIGIGFLDDFVTTPDTVTPFVLTENRIDLVTHGRVAMPLTRDTDQVKAYTRWVGPIDSPFGLIPDFEPAFAWAISTLRQDLMTREAKPVIIFLSEYFAMQRRIEKSDPYSSEYDLVYYANLNPAEYAAASELERLSQLAREAGIRVVTVGHAGEVEVVAEMTRIASAAQDVYLLNDLNELPDIINPLRRSCDSGPTRTVAAIAGEDRLIQNPAVSTPLTLQGRIIDFRLAEEAAASPVTVEWVQTDAHAPLVMVDSSDPNTQITIPSGNPSGYEYTLELRATVGGTKVSSDEMRIRLEDSPQNRSPICKWEMYEMPEDTPELALPVLENDWDLDGDQLYIFSVTPMAPNYKATYYSGCSDEPADFFHGSVSISDDRKALIYRPDPDYNLTIEDSDCIADGHAWEQAITYTITDRPLDENGHLAEGATTSKGIAIVRVLPQVDPPIATDDTITVLKSDTPTPRTLNVLANDISRDATSSDKRLTIVSVSTLSPAPAKGSLDLVGTPPHIEYTPATDAVDRDTETFTYTIRDAYGATASAHVTVIADRTPAFQPTAESDVITVWKGTKPLLDVLQNDSSPSAEALTICDFDDDGQPGRLTIVRKTEGGPTRDMIRFDPDTPSELEIGPHGYHYTIANESDAGCANTAEGTILINFVEGRAQPPLAADDNEFVEIDASAHPILVLENDTGENLSITDVSAPSGGGTATADSGTILYTPPNSTFTGLETFTYTVADPGGRTATATVTVTVYDPTLDSDVIAKLESEGTEDSPEVVRDGIYVPKGIARDEDGQGPFSYTITVSSRAGEVASYHGTERKGTAPDNFESLGSLDLRGVADGVYRVALNVVASGELAEDYADIQLSSDHKVGNLKFSETDATVNVGGVPISVVRTYDSFNTKGGEFGPGWTFDLNDMQIEINETREPLDDLEEPPVSFSCRTGGGRDVSLTLPNGRRVTFPLNLQLTSVIPGSPVTVSVYTASWDSPSGVAAALSSIGLERRNVWFDQSQQKVIWDYWDRNPSCSEEKYDIPGFLLTMPDNSVYHIGREPDPVGEHFYALATTGDYYVVPWGKPRVTQVDLPTGDKYFFSQDAVYHQSPGQAALNPPEQTPVLRIERNTNGLIKAVHDRNSLTDAGEILLSKDPVVFYEYDQTVDPPRLIKVHRLRERLPADTANVTYDTVTYEYNISGKPYLISGIIGPRGVRVAKTSYDEKGRMKKIEQPDGRWVEYHHDDQPTATDAVARERIVDSEGNTTIHDTDAHGNILLTIDGLNNKVARQFDQNDMVEDEEIKDANDNLLLKTATTLKYEGDHPVSGILRRRVVSRGTGSTILKTAQEFDLHGLLTRTVDARNTPSDPDADYDEVFSTVYAYENSQPITTTVHRPSGTDLQLAENVYYTSGDFKGLLKESFDTLGNRTTYTYFGVDATVETDHGRFGDLQSVTVEERINGTDDYSPASQTRYEYDGNGNRTKEVRQKYNGTTWDDYSSTTYEYDGRNRVKKTIDPTGAYTTTTFDADGRTETTTDRYGAVTRYMYNAVGDLIQTTYPDTTVSRTATYYAEETGLSAHKLRHVVTEDRHADTPTLVNGNRTIYDELGRVVRSERLKNILIELSPDGKVFNTVFKSAEEVLAYSLTKYDGAGRVFLSSDMTEDDNKKWTRQDYDDKGRRWRTKSFVDADGNDIANVTITTLYGYDANGGVLWTLDPNQYQYFLANNPSALSGTPADIHAALFDNTENRKRLTWYEYDDFSRQTKVHQPGPDEVEAVTESKYDDAGRRWLEIDPDGRRTAFVLDGLGRLTWVVTDVDSARSALPAPLETTRTGWENWALNGRSADSTVTEYTYDTLGRLTKQTDARGNFTEFEYDELDRRTKRILPDETSEETWAYDYEETGDDPDEGQRINKILHTDFAGREMIQTFDTAGRLHEKKEKVGITITPLTEFDYTASGQRSEMTDNKDGTERITQYAYDEFNRLRVKQTPEGTLTYTYDNAGNLALITTRTNYAFPLTSPEVFDENYLSHYADWASRALMSYEYNGRNRLSTVRDGASASVADYDYDSSGNLTDVAYGNGVTTSYTYNPRNQLRFMASDNGSTIASFDYDDADPSDGFTWPTGRGLSAAGLRRGVREVLPAVSATYPRHVAYTYDKLNRLTRESLYTSQWASENGYAQYDGAAGYTDTGYDKVGNRQARTVSNFPGLSAASYASYTENDWLGNGLSAGHVSALFDDNGNTIKHDLDGNNSWDEGAAEDGYDFENRLISATRGGTSISIVYDGDGHRVRKTVGGSTTWYLVDDRNPTGYAQVVEERDASENTLVTYVYGLDLVSQTRGSATHYFGYDGLGTVRYLTDTASPAHVTDTYTYDAFGILIGRTARRTSDGVMIAFTDPNDETETPAGTSPVKNSYRYTGEQMDHDLGLYYLRARYLNPAIGRFWTMDTYEGDNSDPLSLHKYLYAYADPVNMTDPSGLWNLASTVTALEGTLSLAAYKFAAAVGFSYGAAELTLGIIALNYTESINSGDYGTAAIMFGIDAFTYGRGGRIMRFPAWTRLRQLKDWARILYDEHRKNAAGAISRRAMAAALRFEEEIVQGSLSVGIINPTGKSADITAEVLVNGASQILKREVSVFKAEGEWTRNGAKALYDKIIDEAAQTSGAQIRQVFIQVADKVKENPNWQQIVAEKVQNAKNFLGDVTIYVVDGEGRSVLP